MTATTEVIDRHTVVEQIARGKEGKYLTFVLGNEEYGLDIVKVREIMGMMEITSVPKTPSHIKGVINLRGKVIPITDLRIKFGMPEIEYTRETCVIVVETYGELMGLIVDTVREVLNINLSDIEPAPHFGDKIDTEYILGMAKSGDRAKILLDIERVLGKREDISPVGQL